MQKSFFHGCRRLVAALAGAILVVQVAACVDGQGFGFAPTRITVAKGNVTIAGPSGYCIDTKASRVSAARAFVLLGSCASLSGTVGGQRPQSPAILTATISGAVPDEAAFADNLPAMRRFLSSPVGRAALSRSGQASSVSIIEIETVGNVMYIHARDTAAATGQNVEPDYWRAVTTAKGQIVTLSVLGLRDKPISSRGKRALIEQFVARLRNVNGA
ncbi:MAG: hypothetical protein WBC90_01420 [Albidovulum sp.]|jgi:hypothetical protein